MVLECFIDIIVSLICWRLTDQVKPVLEPAVVVAVEEVTEHNETRTESSFGAIFNRNDPYVSSEAKEDLYFFNRRSTSQIHFKITSQFVSEFLQES